MKAHIEQREAMSHKAIAERDIQLFSGWSGVVGGLISIIACCATASVWSNVSTIDENAWFLGIWVGALVLTVLQDRLFARYGDYVHEKKMSARVIVVSAIGVIAALVLSWLALSAYEYEAIPAIWMICFGVLVLALARASSRRLQVFGVIQVITGIAALTIFCSPAADKMTAGILYSLLKYIGKSLQPGTIVPLRSLLLIAISFGLYPIMYGFRTIERSAAT